MPPNPATDPTERSIPPANTTNVMPIARMAEIATCLDKIAKLFAVKNDGASDEKRINNSNRTKIARPRRSVRTMRAEEFANRPALEGELMRMCLLPLRTEHVRLWD